jgi:hypothetical protein
MSYEYSAFVRYNDPDDPLRLKNLSETPTVTAYEGGDGDSIAGASIANITTGIYKVKVTHSALEPVLFKVIPHNDDKDDFPDEALLAEEVRFVLDDGVTLANTQGAITWGQQKILADKAGEGALHIVNENEDGVGQYNSGAVGQGNLGSMQGQVNCGSITGQYNMAEGNVGVGQHNHSEGMIGIGQSNQATFPVDGYDPALALEATLTAIKGAGWTNETLKAIKDAAGGGGLDAAGVRSAVGLASANLDTQLSGIKTDTGNIQTDTNNVVNRLTAARAGYLDKLNVAGALANTTNAGDFKADVSGIPAAVWGFATRTLSGFGTLVSDIWSFATRTLSAFGFTVATSSDANVTAIKAKTDNLPASPAPAGEYDARLVTIQADLDNPDQYKADISALATSAEVGALNNITAAEVLAEEVIGGYSLAQVLTALAAKMHGLASGAGTTTIAYDGIDGTSNVVVETVDGKGNRSNVVLNI